KNLACDGGCDRAYIGTNRRSDSALRVQHTWALAVPGQVGRQSCCLATSSRAVAQSLWHAQKRPTVVQIAFNMANLTLTIGACHLVVEGLFAAGFETYRPAVMVTVAATPRSPSPALPRMEVRLPVELPRNW